MLYEHYDLRYWLDMNLLAVNHCNTLTSNSSQRLSELRSRSLDIVEF